MTDRVTLHKAVGDYKWAMENAPPQGCAKTFETMIQAWREEGDAGSYLEEVDDLTVKIAERLGMDADAIEEMRANTPMPLRTLFEWVDSGYSEALAEGAQQRSDSYYPESIERQMLGKEVRNIWVAHCREMGDESYDHLKPYAELEPAEKEVDDRIGEQLFALGAYEARDYVGMSLYMLRRARSWSTHVGTFAAADNQQFAQLFWNWASTYDTAVEPMLASFIALTDPTPWLREEAALVGVSHHPYARVLRPLEQLMTMFEAAVAAPQEADERRMVLAFYTEQYKPSIQAFMDTLKGAMNAARQTGGVTPSERNLDSPD